MPDFDQKRQVASGVPGLPGSGAMYCVPHLDLQPLLLRGEPRLSVPRGRQRQLAVAFALQLRHRPSRRSRRAPCPAMRKTARTAKVGSTASIRGLRTTTPGSSATSTTGIRATTRSRADRVAKKAAGGSVVAIAYGRYSIVGDFGGFPLLTRTGGHAVTLTEAFRVGGAGLPALSRPGRRCVQQHAVDVREQGGLVGRLHLRDRADSRRAPHDDGDRLSLLRRQRPAPSTSSRASGPSTCMSFLNTGGGTPTWEAEVGDRRHLRRGADGDHAGVAGVRNLGSCDRRRRRRRDRPRQRCSRERRDAAAPESTRVTGDSTALGGLQHAQALRRRPHRPHLRARRRQDLLPPSPTAPSSPRSAAVNGPTAMAYDDDNDDVLILSVAQRRITRLDKTLASISTFTVPPGVPMSGDGSVIVKPVRRRRVLPHRRQQHDLPAPRHRRESDAHVVHRARRDLAEGDRRG
jgi:hypothetical protein